MEDDNIDTNESADTSENEDEQKVRFQLWMKPSSQKLADSMWKKSNCSCKGDFIEKAILFYCGYLQSEQNESYIPRIVTSTLKSIVDESDNRQNMFLYKIAVELAILQNLFATLSGVSDVELKRVRRDSEQLVRESNGIIDMSKAIEWQSS